MSTEEEALRQAWTEYDRLDPDAGESMEAFRERVRQGREAVVSRVRSLVPPLTLTREQEAADRKPLSAFLPQELSLARAWAEIDALRSALAVAREVLDRSLGAAREAARALPSTEDRTKRAGAASPMSDAGWREVGEAARAFYSAYISGTSEATLAAAKRVESVLAAVGL